MIYRFGIYSYRLRVVTNHGIVGGGKNPSSSYFEGLAPLVSLPPPLCTSIVQQLEFYMIT